MNRRELLRALPSVALLSGCSAPEPAIRSRKSVSVAAVDDVAVHPIRFSLDVRHPRPADHRPPVLEFVAENPTDRPVKVLHSYPTNGDCPVFESDGDPPGIVLAHESVYRDVDLPDQYWQLPRGEYSMNLLALTTFDLSAGETRRVPVGVFGTWRNEDGVGTPPGEHRFVESIQLDVPGTDGETLEFEWGATVSISSSETGQTTRSTAD